jgi:hypothetical protein
MIKGGVVLFNFIGLFLCRLLFPVSVSVSQTVPSSAQINSSFLIQITINKGDLAGVGKFTEQMPAGFTVVPIDNDGAQTSFNNNAIEFSWASLPTDATLNISFRVNVNSAAEAHGDLLLGRFLYTDNNQKLEADCDPSNITIAGDGVAQSTAPAPIQSSADQSNNTQQNTAPVPVPSTTDQSNNTQQNTAPAPIQSSTDQSNNVVQNNTSTQNSDSRQVDNVNIGSGGIFVVRQFPSPSIPPNSDAKIMLTIHKGNITGFAKIEDSIPPGFTAAGMDAGSASFTFADNIAKFVWQSLPPDSVITVSYKISAGADVSGTHVVSGNFSYIYNGSPVLSSIGSTIFNTSASAGNNYTAAVSPAAYTSSDNSSANSGSYSNADIASVTPSIAAPVKGISYRVQIMALHNPVKVSYFSRKVKAHVNTELNDGYTKYTVGNYSDYKSVRGAREDIRAKGIDGPFVVSYNSGARITVQEALMISHQQWYK